MRKRSELDVSVRTFVVFIWTASALSGLLKYSVRANTPELFLGAVFGMGFCFCWLMWKRADWHGSWLIKRRLDGSRAPHGLLIDLCMPPERAEEAMVNILGRYDYWVKKHGPRKARIIFTTQSIGCIVTHWADWAMKRLRLLRLLRRS